MYHRLSAALCATAALVMVLTVLPSVQSSFNVTNNQLGPGRLATWSKSVAVTDNERSVISIRSAQSVNWHVVTYFTATASDPDNDTLRFTWDWGDGALSVTTTPTYVPHVYANKGLFNLYVYADDLTGPPGHNVSALCAVRVADFGTTPPYAVTLSATPLSVWVGQIVTFTGSARDPVVDAMNFNFTFGDGPYTVIGNGPAEAGQVVTDQTTHAYIAAGTWIAYMAASDGLSTTQSNSVIITVMLNSPPSVRPQTNKSANADVSVSFSALATDADGDTKRYTWSFGDGSALQVGQTTTHTYAKAGMYTFSVHVDDLTGLVGHNVSSSATASIAFNLGLAVGWNFVSLPLSGFGYKASTLGLATGDEIVDPSNPPYHIFIKGISPISADFTIRPSSGYWIWVAAAKTLHLYGSVPTTMQTKVLVAGWNAVGFLGFNSRHASDIIGMYSGEGSIVLVAKYTGTGYITYIRGIPANDFLLGLGQACWIWTTGAGALSYMP